MAVLNTQVGTAHFRFPALDPVTEAFLWRRKADLEAALEAMPATATIAAAFAPQGAPGRASADLEDAKALAEKAPDGTKVIRHGRRTSADVALGSSKSKNQGNPGKVHDNEKARVIGRASTGGMGIKRALSVGASAATALLVAGGRSAVLTGARGLQLAMIKEAFSRLDLDKDGYITPEDLGLAFRNMGRDASDRRWIAILISVRWSYAYW